MLTILKMRMRDDVIAKMSNTKPGFAGVGILASRFHVFQIVPGFEILGMGGGDSLRPQI